MKFELNAKQVAKLKKWQTKIHKKYGKYGTYSYTFVPTGIGTEIQVVNKPSNETLDLSMVEDW